MKNRNLTVDCAKGFTIILMLLDHIEAVGYTITSFHMPLFFILSGYFFKEEAIWVVIKKKAKGLLVPYVEISFVTCLFEVLHKKYYLGIDNEEIIIGVKDRVLHFLMGNDFSLAWFLLALFGGSVIYAVIWRISSNKKLIYILLVLSVSVAGYLLGNEFEQKVYQYDLMLFCVLFIATGHMFKKYSEQINKIPSYVILLVSLVVWILGIEMHGLTTALRIYNMYPLCVFAAIAGTYCVVKLSSYMKCIPYYGKYLIWLGANTLPFMCLGNITKNVLDWNSITNINNRYISLIIQLLVFSIIVLCQKAIKKLFMYIKDKGKSEK